MRAPSASVTARTSTTGPPGGARRLGWDEEFHQQAPGWNEMGANALERVLRRTQIDEELERAGGDECGCVAERQVQLGDVLAEQRRTGPRRREALFAARQHRGRAVDTVQVMTALDQRREQAAGAAHEFQHRTRRSRQMRVVPVDFGVGGDRLVGVVESAAQRSVGRSRRGSVRGRHRCAAVRGGRWRRQSGLWRGELIGGRMAASAPPRVAEPGRCPKST